MIDEIFRNEIYFFESNVARPFIIDGGANAGFASLYFKRRYPNSKIIAFEPDPDLVRSMRANLASFGFTDVDIIQKALWSEDTTLHFFSEGSDGGRVATLAGDTQQISTIEAVSLVPYLAQRIDFLKLDIEGAEWDVLNSLGGALDSVQNIFVEYHSFVGKPQHLAGVIEILESAGFRLNVTSPVERVWRPMGRRKNWNAMDLQLNLFGWRESSSR